MTRAPAILAIAAFLVCALVAVIENDAREAIIAAAGAVAATTALRRRK